MKTHDDPEDEAILSAYLDGELDFELRQVVESNIATNPVFADRLRRLQEVRDLLASLSRPRPVDLASEILARIEREQRSPHRWAGIAWDSWVGSSAPHLWGGLTLIAASLVIGLLPILALFRTKPVDHSRSSWFVKSIAPMQHKDRIVTQESNNQTSAVGSLDARPSTTSTSDTQTNTPASKSDRSNVTSKHEVQSVAADPQDRVRQLLESPNLRHVFVVTDTINGAIGDRVASLVEQTAKTDYYVITVAQGIVVDPRRPTEAKVYTFTLNESELDRFRSRARSALGVPHEEIPASPEVVTQLADIGQVFAFTPPAAGEMVIPRADVALKTEAQGSPIVSDSVRSAEGVVQRSQPSEEPTTQAIQVAASAGGEVTREKPQGPPKADSSGSTAINSVTGQRQPESRRADHARSDARRALSIGEAKSPRPVVVLVWVASPRSG